ncbi:MAG TPA: tripartite tricarboxylate transporter substrate binding protein [Burkholderiales bacterium]|nr:tripartite tricarboxylate transporter substrate binding protein [Burkholderiales bacterium]
MKFRLAFAMLLLCATTQAGAQAAQSDYPAQSIRLIVPSGAGGITDVLARILVEKVGPILKQSMFVENKTGASGIVGSDFVAHSKPDGYTLLMAFPSHVANPSIAKSLPYDTVKDFAPITKVGSVTEVLLVDKSSPLPSVKGLIEAAKAAPQPFTYGTVGTGSLGDLATLIFESKAKLKLLHVPYKSEPEIVTALIRGDLQFAFSSPPGALPMLNAGRVRALAISDIARSPIFPDLPTIAESGVPDYNVTGWNAIFAPAGTPPAIIAKLNKAINQALADPVLVKQFFAQGVRPVGCTPEVLQQAVVADIETIRTTLKAAGITPQ